MNYNNESNKSLKDLKDENRFLKDRIDTLETLLSRYENYYGENIDDEECDGDCENCKFRDDDYEDDECSVEIEFLPLMNTETGEIIGVALRKNCPRCGLDIIEQLFTNGSQEAEELATEMGYRDESNMEIEDIEIELEIDNELLDMIEDIVDDKITIALGRFNERSTEEIKCYINKSIEELKKNIPDIVSNSIVGKAIGYGSGGGYYR